jgi:hypothetical protein
MALTNVNERKPRQHSQPVSEVERQFVEDFTPQVPESLKDSAFNKKDGKFTNYSTQACFITYKKLWERTLKDSK